MSRRSPRRSRNSNVAIPLNIENDEEEDGIGYTGRMSGMFANLVPSFVSELINTPSKSISGYFSRPRTPMAEDITFGDILNDGDTPPFHVENQEEEENQPMEVEEPDESAPSSLSSSSSSSSSSPAQPGLQRQWTHTFDDGSRESRVHRKEEDETPEEEEEEAPRVVPEGAGVGVPIGGKLSPPPPRPSRQPVDVTSLKYKGRKITSMKVREIIFFFFQTNYFHYYFPSF